MNSHGTGNQPSKTEKRTSSPTAGAGGFAGNVIAVLGGQLSCAVVAIVVQVCLTRLLGPAGRGQISLALMVISFCGLLGGLGGELPLSSWTAAAKGKPLDWIPSVLWSGVAGSSFVIALVALIYWKWDPSFLKGLTPTLAAIAFLGVPVNIFVSYFMALLTGLERFRIRAGLAVSNQVLSLVCVLWLAFSFGKTAEMALLGTQLGLLLSAIASCFFLREALRGAWDVRRAGSRLTASLSLGLRGMFGNLATFFNYRLDVFVVNYFLDTTQVGLYAVGVLVTEALWQVPQAAALALVPRTARTADEGASRFTCMVLRQVILISAVSGTILAMVCPFVIPLVFGAKFSPSVAVIWWLLPGVVALSAAKVISADLAARGKPEYSMSFAFVALVVTVALDFLLIPRMGIRGAALASSVSYVLDSVLLLVTLKYKFRIPWTEILVPSQNEFGVYQLAWLRCKSWFFPSPSPANASPLS
jgi:O-antigen/teichoic acid export membrane protein